MMISEIKMETLKLKKTCYDLTNLLILLPADLINYVQFFESALGKCSIYV